MVRIWGRKGGAQQVATPLPCESLDEAWSEICRHIKARLGQGGRVVGPGEYVDG